MNFQDSASPPPVSPTTSLARHPDARFAGCGCGCARVSSVCWGPILAGVGAAMALQVLLMMLGAGLGFALYSPPTNENPVAELGMGAVFVQGVGALFSLWFGGWVAGRVVRPGSGAPGWLHGFTVWRAADATDAQTALVQALVTHGGMSPTVAEQTVVFAKT